MKESFDALDNTLLYDVTINTPISSKARTRHLVFKNISYIISNWTSDEFPNVIYITLDAFLNGYALSSAGPILPGPEISATVVTPTDRIAAL